ncbi:hypothetical protein WME73_11815 [Sorangium sp. So ce302]|uniref:hypothetical protein n=1 Tax=Sorangium sp. So ce302 TaxID=3133297 RepID=UPI003F61E827
MRIQISQASLPPDQLAAMLRQAFPRYKVTMRGGVPIVGDGLATGVMLKPDGPGALKTGWAFPSVAAQMLIMLIILAGLLPGLTLFLIVYLAAKGGVARMEQEIATVLQGGPHRSSRPECSPSERAVRRRCRRRRSPSSARAPPSCSRSAGSSAWRSSIGTSTREASPACSGCSWELAR